MKTKILSALLATALVPAAAFAQGTTAPAGETTPPAAGTSTTPADGASGAMAPATGSEPMAQDGDATPAGEVSADSRGEMVGPFVTVADGAWRTSDLEGKSVEDANGENIGSITDVLVDDEGTVLAVLVGVGGFLGIGTKDVAVSMDSLEFGPGATEGLQTEAAAESTMAAAPATGTATAPAGGTATDTAAATAESEPPVIGEDNLPDRIVLNVTRDELEAAPAYGEPESAEGEAVEAETEANETGAMAPAGGAMAPAGGTAPAAGGTAPQ